MADTIIVSTENMTVGLSENSYSVVVTYVDQNGEICIISTTQ